MADDASGFSAEERDAMKERAKELRASRGKKDPATLRAEGELEVRSKIAELPDDDRLLAEKIFDLVQEHGPELVPRTYYGMPAWAKDGKVLCFFQPRSKFKVRYATFGFDPTATLDEGTVWPTSWAVTALTDADLKALGALIGRAAA